MTKEEFASATIIYNRMEQYERLAKLIKDAREDNKLTTISICGPSRLTIDIPNNGLDFNLILLKIEDELERLCKEYKEEFEQL